MKNLAKSTVWFLVAIGLLGAIGAIASVSNCGAPCEFAAKQAADMSESLKAERNKLKAAEVSETVVQ